MADGVTGENLENAVLPVEMEQKNARVPAPVPLRLVVALIVQDPAQIQNLVKMALALVSVLHDNIKNAAEVTKRSIQRNVVSNQP